MDNWQIHYLMTYKNTGKLFDLAKPYMVANINAKTKEDAVRLLIAEFPMCDIKVKKIVYSIS